MKLTRRDFLRGGAVTAIALAVGVKAKAIKPPISVPYHDHENGGFGKLVITALDANYEPIKELVALNNVSPELLRDAEWRRAWMREAMVEMAFLHGDPDYPCLGILEPT